MVRSIILLLMQGLLEGGYLRITMLWITLTVLFLGCAIAPFTHFQVQWPSKINSTPARIWKGQGATGQKGIVIRETEYLDSRKNVKISSPIQF